MSTQTVNGLGGANVLNVGSNVTTGDVSLGSGVTSGDVTVGNLVSGSGSVEVGTQSGLVQLYRDDGGVVSVNAANVRMNGGATIPVRVGDSNARTTGEITIGASGAAATGNITIDSGTSTGQTVFNGNSQVQMNTGLDVNAGNQAIDMGTTTADCNINQLVTAGQTRIGASSLRTSGNIIIGDAGAAATGNIIIDSGTSTGQVLIRGTANTQVDSGLDVNGAATFGGSTAVIMNTGLDVNASTSNIDLATTGGQTTNLSSATGINIGTGTGGAVNINGVDVFIGNQADTGDIQLGNVSGRSRPIQIGSGVGPTTLNIFGNPTNINNQLNVNNGRITLTSGQGIQFGSSTNDAFYLDDFEQGSWTPTIEDATGNEFTHSSQIGQYTKIKDWIFFNLSVVYTSKVGVTASDAVRITLPSSYAAANITNFIQGGYICRTDCILVSAPSDREQVGANINPGATHINLERIDFSLGTRTVVDVSDLESAGALRIGGQYYVGS